jgi:hypothetical protein
MYLTLADLFTMGVIKPHICLCLHSNYTDIYIAQ